ncbi:hypothetical protein ACSBR1_034485 [Camellia fascicularis]
MKINGCITQINDALYIKQFSSIGPACCKVINTRIEETCWPRMFPFRPKFPSLIKDHCANFAATPESIL